MSVNGKQSCASCHRQELALTDGRAIGLGATIELHSRGAMSLVNVAYNGALTWNNPEMKTLEKQALIPMFGNHARSSFTTLASRRRARRNSERPRFATLRSPLLTCTMAASQRSKELSITTHRVARTIRAKDHLIGGFKLSPQDKADLVEYLKSLTDEEVTRDPRFANLWPAHSQAR